MKSILLIEPDRVLANTYKEALKRRGFNVVVCGGAQSAINLTDKLSPSLIILELQLTGHSGFEFLYELRSYKDWQSIPAIILTSISMSEFEDNWEIIKRELGVVSYLYKPTTNLIALSEQVEEIL